MSFLRKQESINLNSPLFKSALTSSGNSESCDENHPNIPQNWIPAFAGMTVGIVKYQKKGHIISHKKIVMLKINWKPIICI